MRTGRWFALGIALLGAPAPGQDLQALSAAADAGDAWAQTSLGYRYANGRGVPQDYALALKYYSRAAQTGYPRAVFNLGTLYENGLGVPRDYAMAFRYYSQAAQAGDDLAKTSLGYLYSSGLGVARDYAMAMRYYRQAAQAGNARALNNIGYLYENGLGVPRDYGAAFQYYAQAARAGDALGQTSLGHLYRAGLGVARDDAAALRYYTMAAQAGVPQAINNLGSLYDNGWGVPRDYAMAFKYYSQAAQAGNAQAQCNLGLMYKNGRGVPADVSRAMALFQQSFANGHGAAAFNLGLMYRDGLDGVPDDPNIANSWFNKAVALGYVQAASFIVNAAPRAVRGSRDLVPFDPAPQAAIPAARPVLTGVTVPKGPRLALVIANSDYSPNLNSLKNPVNDGRLVAAALAKAGFSVTARYNLGTLEIKAALTAFVEALRKAGPGTTALFYYAGHGAAAQGVNYLIPVGQKIDSQTALQTYGQSAEEILNLLDQAKPVTTIVILDACRNVPFGSARGSGGGLAQMDARNGSIIGYATAPGHLAADGDGDDSPYSTALAELIGRSNEPVEIVFRRVRAKVIEQTQNEQTPWESTSLVSDFSFLPK